MANEKILAIDVGRNHIKVGYAINGKTKSLLEIDTPENSVYDGRVVEPQQVADVLSGTVKAHKWKPTLLAVSVNTSTYIIRQFKIPFFKEEMEVRGALELQITETLSTILDTHAMSYSIYNETPEFLSGILVLVPKDLIASYVAVSEIMELEPAYMDIHPNAIAKYYKKELFSTYKAQNAIMIDFGEMSTNLTLTSEGRILFNRFVPGGSNMVDEMLERELGLLKDQALQCRLGNYEQFGITEDDMRKYIRLSCMRIEDEIRQTIDFFTYNKLDGRIEGIVLYGNGSKMDLFYQHLKDEHAIPVYRVENNTNFMNVLGCLIHKGGIIKENILFKKITFPKLKLKRNKAS